jgi:hypothetical protein
MWDVPVVRPCFLQEFQMSAKSSAFPRKVVVPPSLADARARKSFAERLQCFGFTENAARCIADATVDPTTARKFIGEPESPNYEVRRTPIGIVKGIPVEVWATRVTPDPRNPRTSPEKKHPFAVDPGTGDSTRRYPPIPDPRSAEPHTVPELVITIQCPEHLATAHSLAADYIGKHNDWEDSIRNQGVMEPIWLAATTYRHTDGTPDAIALTTVDGSSRLTAVHKILRDKWADFLKLKSADVPYRGEDDPKFRADLRRMSDWIETDAGLDDSREAILRNVVVPAFIIVGFESERPSTTFHTAVKSLVALRHVDPPTPWGTGPEHESLADEVVDQLESATLITPEEAKYLRGALTRDEAAKANLSPDPAIRAARIIDVFLKRDDAFKIAIRSAVTAQSTRKQSSPKLMKELAAALILRGLDLSPREAEQKRKYVIKSIPSAVERRGKGNTDWQATGKSHEQLMLDALDEVRGAKASGKDEPGPATVELAVRSILPLVANSALTGIRGFDRTKDTDERAPALVIDAMRLTQRGVRQLGTVLGEYAEGKKAFRAVDVAGNDVVGEDPKQPVTLSDTYLRAEYPDPDKVPAPRTSGDQPRDIFNQRIHDLQTVIERLDVAREQVKGCREHDGTVLAEKYGVDYRACRKWLEVIHQVAKDLAIWEQNDIKYNGRRHDDESDYDVPNPDLSDDADSDEQPEDESDE